MLSLITLKVFIGLLSLFIVTRLMGKKELAQLMPFDFIFILVLGGFMEEAMYDSNVSILHFLYAIGLWSLLIYLIEISIRRFDRLRPIMKGSPSIIIQDGELVADALKKNKLESEQLRVLLRQQGVFSITDVKFAILETSGALSIMKKEEKSAATAQLLGLKPEKESLTYLLIDEGVIKKKELQKIGKDESWLRQLLHDHGYHQIEPIYYAEWSETNGLIVMCEK